MLVINEDTALMQLRICLL